jgi:chromosomal replication initiator protein
MLVSSKHINQVNDIQSIVSRITGVKTIDICLNSRKAEIAQARQLSMYFCRFYTRITTKEIARMHGKGNHGTVLHACKTVEDLRSVNPKFNEIFQSIKSELI